MGKQAVSFEGSVTTTGRSEAVRLEKAFFRAHPEFRQKARVRAQAIGEGHVLVSVAEPLVPYIRRGRSRGLRLSFLPRSGHGGPPRASLAIQQR